MLQYQVRTNAISSFDGGGHATLVLHKGSELAAVFAKDGILPD